MATSTYGNPRTKSNSEDCYLKSKSAILHTMKHLGVLCIVLCFRVVPVGAQTDSLGLPSLVVHDVQTAMSGALHIFASPGRWDGADWVRVGATLGITAGSALLDADMRTLMQRNTGAADGLSNVAVTYGNGWFAAGITAGLYGTGVVIRDPWLRETAVLAGTAIIVSTVVTRVIKPVVGRARPYVNAGNGAFHMFSLQDDYNSFPSGHTVAAFSLSSVLAARIDRPLATIGLYGLACLTALSRVYTDEHWFSDVVFGGIFASAVGRSLVLWHEAREPDRESFRIFPGPDRVTVAYFF
jgi:membrane-associated phospholipid phosphatase